MHKGPWDWRYYDQLISLQLIGHDIACIIELSEQKTATKLKKVVSWIHPVFKESDNRFTDKSKELQNLILDCYPFAANSKTMKQNP